MAIFIETVSLKDRSATEQKTAPLQNKDRSAPEQRPLRYRTNTASLQNKDRSATEVRNRLLSAWSILNPPLSIINQHTYIMKKLILFVALAWLALTAMAIDYTVQNLPDPKLTCADCFVCNPDAILSPETEQAINENCRMLKQYSNAELAVVAINAFDEREYGDAFNFAQSLFNTWGIGDKENNAGVLVLFALQSRDIRIHTGGGLEGLLPDIVCDEIIENNIQYLSDGDYDSGLQLIVNDIIQNLITDNARAELMLGYKPQSTEYITDTSWYFYIAILLVMLLSVIAYRQWNDPKVNGRQKLMENTQLPQSAMGCLSFLFPLPMLLLWVYFMLKRKKIRTEPYVCPNCKSRMKLLGLPDRNIYLMPQQQTEEKLFSADYDVWMCPACAATHVETYKGQKYSKYKECPHCHARAEQYDSLTTLVEATTTSTGKRLMRYKCAHCGNVREEIRIIPIVVPPSSSRSSYGGSSRSYGGSSRSSGGSWGGGSSFGGGAGRKF